MELGLQVSSKVGKSKIRKLLFIRMHSSSGFEWQDFEMINK